MNIVLVISSLQAGGAERVMSILANGLCERDHVTLVKLSELDDHYEVDPRVEIRSISAGPRTLTSRLLINRCRIIWRLRQELQRAPSDVVLSFIDLTNIRTLIAARGLGVPVIISERTDPTRHRIKVVHRVLRKVVYPWADVLVVQTEAVARWARTFMRENAVRVIPNPVVLDGTDTTERADLVIAMGRLAREKGFEVLLDAFAASSAVTMGWRLCILGDGPERTALSEQARRLGLTDVVDFPGVVSDPRLWLRRAGLFVLPSRYEGFPNALLEAMTCGAPVIASDCPSGPAEIVCDDSVGRLVQVGDVRTLAGAIDELLADAPARMRLGDRGRASVRRFAAPEVIAQWHSLLRSVASTRSPRDDGP